jgi:hypothetical protein
MRLLLLLTTYNPKTAIFEAVKSGMRTSKESKANTAGTEKAVN